MNRYQNHTGLFVYKSLYNNARSLRAMRFCGLDVFDRPQIALDSDYITSWEGHDVWDRCTAIIFDVHGFVKPYDGTLSRGCTYDGEPLEFTRTPLDLREFDFSPTNCMELYLNHLDKQGHLELIGPEDPLVHETLEAAAAERRDGGADILAAKFADLGFLTRHR